MLTKCECPLKPEHHDQSPTLRDSLGETLTMISQVTRKIPQKKQLIENRKTHDNRTHDDTADQAMKNPNDLGQQRAQKDDQDEEIKKVLPKEFWEYIDVF
ncbi:hypothetical protein LOZ66_001225 [Ophidiomyces ophidiicola]|nr:hypothetical protein LOZ66_001225 [Ophidiomyces ophidiicola]